MAEKNQYVIIRDDLPIDPLQVTSEGLLIGRLLECEVVLNHPAVSRVQAGIKQVEGHFFLFPLRPTNPVVLNGKPIQENEALAAGDLLMVGPFRLAIESADDSLIVRVSLEIAVNPSEIENSQPGFSTEDLQTPTDGKKKARAAPIQGTKALDIFWDKRIREAGKVVRPSPLFPKSQRRSGKAQASWTPTSDLKSHWPISLVVWSIVVAGALSAGAAYWYTRAYSPGPISNAHSISQMSLVPPIATNANAGSCTSCHGLKGSMDGKCSACHQTATFAASVIPPHAGAGIGCVDCHAEHRGANFSATEGAIASCTECHNNENPRTFNGRKVGTPHGGGFGYPVVNGVWSGKSINEEEWDLRKLPIERLPTDSEDKWRSKQFHALHSQRVKLVGNLSGNAQGQLSCSSCHKSFEPIDRETPRTTCGLCHNGMVDARSNKILIEANKPNCTSCHVQHVHDTHRWGASMLAQPTPQPAGV